MLRTFLREINHWSLYAPPGLTCKYSTFCPHSVFMCFVWIREQSAIISLHSTDARSKYRLCVVYSLALFAEAFVLSHMRCVKNDRPGRCMTPPAACSLLTELTLCWEIIAVCSQIHTKHINTLCGLNVELLNVKLAVHIVTTGL